MIVAAFFVAMLSVVDVTDADRAYAAGRFDEAHRLYLESYDPVRPDAGRVLFKLGNSAFKLGRYGEAVWHYRRAERFLGEQPELENNLSLAERRLGIRRHESPQGFLARLGSYVSESGDNWIIVALVVEAAACLLYLLRRDRRSIRRIALSLGIGGAVIALALVVITEPLPSGERQGVVISDDARLRADPSPGAATLDALLPGTLVVIEESSDRWARVAADGREGWLRREQVGLLD